MAAVNPNTGNVKLGVCRVFFGGENLGFTKGGVEVEVMTNTSKINVDQLGDTDIDEILRGRMIRIKCPLAESSLALLQRMLPGATNVDSGGTKATGTITISTNPANGETIVVNGVTFTFRTAAPYPYDVLIGATATDTATNLAAKLNAYPDTRISVATYTPAAAVVTVQYKTAGTEGNAYTLVTGTAAAKVTMSGATLTGGTVTTVTNRVDSPVGTGVSLIKTAKALRLHPIERGDLDYAEDLNVPLANTDGSMSFAYKLDEVRVYNVEFTGYPDPNANFKLFSLGDPAAV
jgi:hypothetical protein